MPPGLTHCQFFQTFALYFFFSPLALPLFGREINLTQAFPHAKNQRPYADSIYLVRLKIAQAGRKHFSWQTSKLDPTAV